MTRSIEFLKRETIDPLTNKKGDEVVVLRDGREVAALPEAERLDRVLALPLKEAKWIASHFDKIMLREPTPDEREFWKAIVDYKHQAKAQLDGDVSIDDVEGQN